jgi:FixJ family two-component response regulator
LKNYCSFELLTGLRLAQKDSKLRGPIQRASGSSRVSAKMFTVYLVDDDANMLKALSRLIGAKGYDVRPFGSAQEFLAQHDPAIPGCAIFDLRMPGLDGLQLQQVLSSNSAQRPIIFLTGTGDIPTSVRAMKAGAVDFLTKPVRKDDLFQAISRAEEVDSQTRQAGTELAAAQAKIASLTPREREVLSHVVAGRLNKQIAGDLGTVEKTIKFHRGRIMQKLGMRTVADLVRLAEKAGLPIAKL